MKKIALILALTAAAVTAHAEDRGAKDKGGLNPPFAAVLSWMGMTTIVACDLPDGRGRC